MSEFEERIKKLAKKLSPEAKELIATVIEAEHKKRFSDRSSLSSEFATAALQAAKRREISS